jgi:DNA-binding CsgD family transcriptional regulator
VLAPPELSDRELQVLRLIANGRSNAQIARELHLSVNTVKTHATRIFRRLGVVGREHAVAIGFCLRLLSPRDVRRPS